MSNLLNVALIESIQTLFSQGWSRRRIAQELGVDRGTVGKYVRQRLCGAKPANLPTGSDGSKPATLAGWPGPDSKPANLPTGSASLPTGTPTPGGGLTSPVAQGPPSLCEPHRATIVAQVEGGQSARRIWQDLVAEQGFTAGYDSVRRFVRRLGRTRAVPFRRMECDPGEEAQVDFGSGAPVIGPDGKRRPAHVFRIVLSHSRKGYSEATFTQTTEDFLRSLENAFAQFGGVPRTAVIDNLKAAVAHPDWFDPELTPKVQAFCRHYGIVILPTRPYLPRHKGKVEAGVKYVKNNALKGRTFASLEEQNRFLAEWERTVADTRIHGTTKRQVSWLFEQERPALQPLIAERFPCFHEARRKVNRDGHVEVAKAYYSAPPEYLGREVWVRWDARLVRLFNHRLEQIAVHVRHERGRFSTHAEHIVREKISGLERGADYLLHKVSVVGPFTRQWAEAVVTVRGIEGTRVLQGLVALTRKHSCAALEKACETALSHGCWRLKSVRQLLGRQTARQAPLPFLEEHPIIRPLADYAAIVARAVQRQADRPSVGEGLRRHDRTKVCAARRAAEDPGREVTCVRGSADTLPSRPGYPSPGCTSAEPGCASPDSPTVVPRSSFHQE